MTVPSWSNGNPVVSEGSVSPWRADLEGVLGARGAGAAVFVHAVRPIASTVPHLGRFLRLFCDREPPVEIARVRGPGVTLR